jgi:hypothetical protein
MLVAVLVESNNLYRALRDFERSSRWTGPLCLEFQDAWRTPSAFVGANRWDVELPLGAFLASVEANMGYFVRRARRMPRFRAVASHCEAVSPVLSQDGTPPAVRGLRE